MPRAKLGRVTLRYAKRDRSFRAAVGPRGWEVCVDGRRVGAVSPLFVGWSNDRDGWYFVAADDKLGIPLRNTCGERGVSEEDVKKSAVAYVKQCLAAKATQQSSEGEKP